MQFKNIVIALTGAFSVGSAIAGPIAAPAPVEKNSESAKKVAARDVQWTDDVLSAQANNIYLGRGHGTWFPDWYNDYQQWSQQQYIEYLVALYNWYLQNFADGQNQWYIWYQQAHCYYGVC